jgi:hypothetical protein
MAGLNGAVRAWDNGRGPWRTMRVATRIAAVEKFAAEMLTRCVYICSPEPYTGDRVTPWRQTTPTSLWLTAFPGC